MLPACLYRSSCWAPFALARRGCRYWFKPVRIRILLDAAWVPRRRINLGSMHPGFHSCHFGHSQCSSLGGGFDSSTRHPGSTQMAMLTSSLSQDPNPGNLRSPSLKQGPRHPPVPTLMSSTPCPWVTLDKLSEDPTTHDRLAPSGYY